MKINYFISSLAIVLALVAVFYSHSNRPRIAYVDMGILYENFALKKELDEKLKTAQEAYSAQIDSLEFTYKELYTELASLQKNPPQDKVAELQKIERIYQHKVQQRDETLQTLNKEYNEQIWNRINEYVEEYGEKNSYRFILGANGMGSIMYAEDPENITARVTEYINNKFEGK